MLTQFRKIIHVRFIITDSIVHELFNIFCLTIYMCIIDILNARNIYFLSYEIYFLVYMK